MLEYTDVGLCLLSGFLTQGGKLIPDGSELDSLQDCQSGGGSESRVEGNPQYNQLAFNDTTAVRLLKMAPLQPGLLGVRATEPDRLQLAGSPEGPPEGSRTEGPPEGVPD